MQDMRERYRTLTLYNCAHDPKELADAHALPEQWQAIRSEAKNKDRRMVKVKERFAAVTKEQIEEFAYPGD